MAASNRFHLHDWEMMQLSHALVIYLCRPISLLFPLGPWIQVDVQDVQVCSWTEFWLQQRAHSFLTSWFFVSRLPISRKTNIYSCRFSVFIVPIFFHSTIPMRCWNTGTWCAGKQMRFSRKWVGPYETEVHATVSLCFLITSQKLTN